MTKEQKIEMYAMYLDGCTYQEIGDKFGISRQRVHQLLCEPLAKVKGKSRQLSETCIYDGLSRFIKANSASCAEIANIIQRSMTNTYQKIVGKKQFTISEIYKILEYTSMTFEECFKLKEREEK